MPSILLSLLLLTSAATDRIVGGEEIFDTSFSSVAAIVEAATPDARLGLVCGATVIEERWVLTTASCVDGWAPGDLEVVTGRHDLSSNAGVRRGVISITSHPGFGLGTVAPDAALVELDGPSGVSPARTTRRVPEAGTVVGWGDTRADDRFPNERHHVGVEVADDETCAEAHGSGVDTRLSFCAGGATADACRGDEGGPLFDNRGRLAGVIGPAAGCAIEGRPRIFTRISVLRAWVFDLTGVGVTCRGRIPTIAGSDGDDLLMGTPGDDVIVGFGGDDRIDGLGGNDIICAGPGSDEVDGGMGDDVLIGAEGNDVLTGGVGTDLVRGGSGSDMVRGGYGDDRLSGGSGDDTVQGGADADRISGRGGDDILDGGAGPDYLTGGPGQDTLSGGEGDDVLLGGTDNDDLAGGSGADILRGMGGADHADGGDGVDECRAELVENCGPLAQARL